MKQTILMAFAITCVFFSCNSSTKDTKTSVKPLDTSKPNIVVIYTDDLGYGDVSCYGSTTISTPNIDKLAAEGVKFTEGHCTSATCTPSRYGLLTGDYPFRNKGAHILPGDAPLLIDPNMTTFPSMLRDAGYYTGIVGKWHLGLGNGNVDWNKKVSPTTLDVGFNYEFIMAATNDRVPTVYLENGMVQGLDPNDPIEINYKKNFGNQPTGRDNPELLKLVHSHGHDYTIVNGIGRIGYMKGGEKAKWVDENMADTFLVRAQQYVRKHKEESFFLYYALNQPHVPRTPHPRFVGKSGLGARGDAIVEADWCIGEFMKTLKEEGLAENTIVIFSSDNGPVLDDGYHDEAETKIGNHDQLGGLRGGKYSLLEGGTKVPFIIHWPGTIEPSVSDALVCQVDLMASIGSLLNIPMVEGKDSKPMMDTFLGKSKKGRKELVVEATGRLSFISDVYTMIPPHKGRKITNKFVKNETGNLNQFQLYNYRTDPGQTTDIAKSNPEIVEKLNARFEEIVK